MSRRFALTVFAAATLCSGAPAFAQASGIDPDRMGAPRVAPPAAVPAPPAAVPAQPAAPRGDRREQGPRDASRAPRQQQPQVQPGAETNRGGQQDRRYGDRRHDDRRHGNPRGHDHRSYGYVVPRPNIYYAPPPVYYGGPSVYYGGAQQPYYPSYGYNGYSGYNAGPVTFQPGDYLPPEYRQQQFVVLDWEWRGLSAPPYGYQWMLLGPDNYALVAMSTGQIVSLFAAR